MQQELNLCVNSDWVPDFGCECIDSFTEWGDELPMPKVHYLRENGIGKGTVEELQLGSLCMEVRQQYTRVTFLYFTVSRNVHFDLKHHFLQRCAPFLSTPMAAAHPDKTCTVQFQETQDQTSGQGGSMHSWHGTIPATGSNRDTSLQNQCQLSLSSRSHWHLRADGRCKGGCHQHCT